MNEEWQKYHNKEMNIKEKIIAETNKKLITEHEKQIYDEISRDVLRSEISSFEQTYGISNIDSMKRCVDVWKEKYAKQAGEILAWKTAHTSLVQCLKYERIDNS